MNFLRKFLDVDAPVAEGGGVDIAALMATQGYNSDNKPEPKEQVEDKGNNEQAEKPEVETQAATVSAETKVETPVQEAETQVEQKAEPVVEAVKPAEVVKQPTLQEVLKQQQPDTVLKELGYDDKKVGLIQKLKDIPPQLVGLIETWESNGDLQAYVKEWSTDYTKMSSEDVMRSQLRLEYPKASDKAIEALFKDEVVEKYKLDSEKYSEDEVENGRLLLDAKADKFRDSLQQRQQDFLIPKAPEPAPIVPDNSEQEYKAKIENYKQGFNNDPYIKDIYTNGKIFVGEGEDKFGFPVDANEMLEVLVDDSKMVDLLFTRQTNEKGEEGLIPKVQHQALVAAVALYGKDFLKALVDHSKSIGAKVIDQLENAKQTDKQVVQSSILKPASAAEAMAKGGVLRN